MRANDRDLIRGGHYGQRSCEPHSKAEHMAAPTNAALVKITLANAEPSTHDPKRTCRSPKSAKNPRGLPRLSTFAQLLSTNVRRDIFNSILCHRFICGKCQADTH